MLTEPSKIELSLGGEFTSYPRGESIETAYFNCSLRGPVCPKGDRKPIDIVVVLDRSGSMQGQKLDLCKKTIRFLVEELSASDRLGLITYDTSVRTEFGLRKMTESGKEETEQILKKLHSGDCTNLSGGLVAGIQEVQKPTESGAPNPVRSVLILTDGLANRGITRTPEIVKLVEGTLEPNVSIFTFGYGSDHNAEMLRSISEVGNGVYYFVQNVDGVKLAFADCLGGLLSVVAQNITVECFATNGCTIRSIKTRKPKREVIPHKRYELDLGDLYGEEERDVLVEVSLPNLSSENLEFVALDCKVSYANVLESSLDVVEASGVVRRPNELTPSDKVPNSQITQQRNRIVAAEALERANAEAEKGRLAEGKWLLQRAMDDMTERVQFLIGDDTVATTALMDDLKECKESLANRSVYNKRGRMRMKAKVQGHWNQRSNDVELEDDQIMREFNDFNRPCFQRSEPVNSSACSGYRNTTKKMMLSRAIGQSKSTK
jgi:uncharacterized protein YegL